MIESGGDNLAATFSPELVDLTIYVIDVGMGGDIPRKGGLALKKSDLLIINKTDLAPHVDVDLDQMRKDVEITRNGLLVSGSTLSKDSFSLRSYTLLTN